MNKWKYKYSFVCGILFILSFLYKEVIVISETFDNILVLWTTYLLMILYLLALFTGFLKYSLLNEKTHLFWTSITVVLFYSLRIFIESISVSGFISDNNLLIPLSNYTLAIGLFLWGITIIIQKKIYGKNTLLQGLTSILFAFSMILPLNRMIILLRPLIFLILFISITYLIKKNERKAKSQKDKNKPRMLRNDLF